jgi:peptidyl-prolyl cis-trans isomerase SurA
MTRLFLSLLIAVMMVPVFAPHAQAQSESIAAIVNNDAVTMSDVAARMKLIMVSSGMPNTDEMRAKIQPQIINMLIDESLILQEARRQNITVSEEEIAKGFEALSAQNKFTGDQFRTILARSGIPQSTLNDQIRSQLAWTKVIQKKIRPKIDISDNQIEASLQKLKSKEGSQEYLLGEIFLPVDNQQQEANVKQFADRLTAELSSGKAPFTGAASQFSQSASASKGGDMGWVQGGQLPQEVDAVLQQMKEGELSKPIRSLSGYYIIVLRKTRQITADTMPSRDDIRQQIGMSQLDRMQRRYLLDVKSSAFIERRV